MNQHLPTITEFVMEASDAESMAQSLNLPSVLHLLHSAQSLARPPISNFHVAAVGLGSDGRLFIGVNLEFPGVPLHHSVHAEQFLLTNLALHRCPRLLSLAVSAAPCAHCRQFFQELRHSSSLQILITNQENRSPNLEYKTPNFNPLSKILPNPFGPYDLLDQETPLLLEQHKNGLYLSPQIETPIEENCGEFCNENREITKLSNGYCENLEKNEIFLREAALEAANNAHAPYSRCPSGVALMDCEGKVHTGSYAESAAYNPSLGPVQAALVAYIAGGGGGYERIVAAVLVEKEGAKVRQEDTARLLLKAVSPKCEFRVFRCEARLDSI